MLKLKGCELGFFIIVVLISEWVELIVVLLWLLLLWLLLLGFGFLLGGGLDGGSSNISSWFHGLSAHLYASSDSGDFIDLRYSLEPGSSEWHGLAEATI